jgi:hypothetical protein
LIQVNAGGAVLVEPTLPADAIPAFADTPFPVLQMLPVRAHLRHFPHQEAQGLVAFFRIPSFT